MDTLNIVGVALTASASSFVILFSFEHLTRRDIVTRGLCGCPHHWTVRRLSGRKTRTAPAISATPTFAQR